MPNTRSSASLSLSCFCGRTYSNSTDLEEHRSARGHFESHRCGIRCSHPPVARHDGHSHQCSFCGKICERLDILQDHITVARHYPCSDCGVAFERPATLKAHQNSAIHMSGFECCDCKGLLEDIDALASHIGCRTHQTPQPQKPKKAKGTKAKENICKDCQRRFSSVQALEQHQQSLKHKPLSKLRCPMGKGCKSKFASPSALLHHLESGKCHSGIDRVELYLVAQACDQDGIIHNDPAFLQSSSSSAAQGSASMDSNMSVISAGTRSEWSSVGPSSSRGSRADSDEEWQLLEDSQDSLSRRLSIESMTEPTIRCPLCRHTRRDFATVLDLQQHMDSPVHAAKMYHCPSISFGKSDVVKRGHNEEKYFSTLSGLAQHLESGACRGGKKGFLQCMDIVQRRLEDLGIGEVPFL